MTRLIVRHIPKRPASYANSLAVESLKKTKAENQVEEKKNKKEKKNNEDMINEEQISAAETQANNLGSGVKVVKKDRGLIERTESSKIILTEDNRQVLND